MSDVTPIAGELGISEITVNAHRGKAMQKMKADSLADLLSFIVVKTGSSVTQPQLITAAKPIPRSNRRPPTRGAFLGHGIGAGKARQGTSTGIRR
jgi:hypothetical protein